MADGAPLTSETYSAVLTADGIDHKRADRTIVLARADNLTPRELAFLTLGFEWAKDRPGSQLTAFASNAPMLGVLKPD